ncbi:hypothetical protein LSTR_LSTR012119 [Laodelphax striatellus]|uniref:Uncharacterized protein n=1 Tax=Laodelphax striatellus TaxID=195883 RepID=A0A482WYC8_LAOST|nr:hypothetical protein LSTR_LSTR012119 [Laodelphax striatellus]
MHLPKFANDCVKQSAQKVSSTSPVDDPHPAVAVHEELEDEDTVQDCPAERLLKPINPEGLSPREVLLHPLHDIVEEEDLDQDQDSVSSSISLALRQRLCSSPSPNTLPARDRKKVRTRSVTSTTSSDSGSHKMQAEQGSIGDLHKYHNKYLRNRRHTLANVR